LVQQQTAYWLAGMFKYLKWLFVVMALTSCAFAPEPAPEYAIRSISYKEPETLISSSTATDYLKSKRFILRKVVRIIESVKDKKTKILDISYEKLQNFNRFEEKNCSPDSFKNKFLYHSERKFLSNCNLKSYYDACLDGYKAKCKKSLRDVFSKYLDDKFVGHIEKYYSLQPQFATLPTKELLEKLKLKPDNFVHSCEEFLVLFKKVEETFYPDRKTILDDLNKQAPELRTAVEFCENLP
jgi:dsDNA-specific endonuclease/ATPase MutS2